jgi:hypothetical protein
MRIVVSPYHLTTREAPALAALQLAEQVVTMMPTPMAGTSRRHIAGAVAAAPKYLDFMESWRWSAALWDAGVIAPTHEGLDAADDVRFAFDRIAGDERYAPLRPLMKPRVFEDDRDYLQAIAADVLKGGPDPAITVPVAAGLDRFAARHRLAVARATPTSISQKVEAQLGERVAAFAVPILAQASADRILMLREELEGPLDDLREALREATPSKGGRSSRLDRAARAYATAFDASQGELTQPLDPDEPRVITATVAATLVTLPATAVLESSLAAMRSLGFGARGAVRGPGQARGGASVCEASAQGAASGASAAGLVPALWDADSAPVLSLVFRVIGKR